MTPSNSQDAIIPIWKPQMITSTDIVRKVKSQFDFDKVGHCGTLDPFAEGVLVILSGNKTSKSDHYMNSVKTYRTTIVFGRETDTLDRLGEIIRVDDSSNSFTEDDIRSVLIEFIGKIYQRPPSFSAKKINGVRLYKFARKDIFIHLKPVLIEIEAIKFISFRDNELTIEVTCHKGTYIRQLGSDIARKLGTFGYLKDLTRTSLGDFNLDNSFQLEDIEDWKFIHQ